MKRSELARCIPTGSRRIRNQAEALRVGLSHPDLQTVKDCFRTRLEDFWRIHVNHASWGGPGKAPCGVSSPGRATVCGKSALPMSVSTYKNCRRWWEERGFIAIVRPGWAPLLRAGALLDPERDHATSQAYVLCVPRRTRHAGACGKPAAPEPAACGKPAQSTPDGESGGSTCPLTGSGTDPVRVPTHAREEKSTPGTRVKAGKAGAPRHPLLRRGTLRTLTDGWWAHLTWVFAVEGWTASDLVWAIDHLPDGRQHRMRSGSVRSPAGWLRWRLGHWLRGDGTALPSPSQARAERARLHRERQLRQDAELGLSAASARLRAVDAAYEHAGSASAPPRPQDAPERRERPTSRLVGWAARTARPRPAPAPRTPDPEWDAVVAAMAAAAEAQEAAERDGQAS